MPTSYDRAPLSTDNPRHAVWIDDEQGLRRITAANPGAEQITVGGTLYQHTAETTGNQAWIYTKVPS